MAEIRERVGAKVAKGKKALTKGVLATTAVLAASGAYHVNKDPNQEVEHARDAVVRTVQGANDLGIKGFVAAADMLESGEKVDHKVSVEPLVNKEIEDASISRVADIFYPGTDGVDRAELANQIKITREYMLRNVLTDESYANIDNHMDLFNNIEKYSGVPKEVLIGLALEESGGGVNMGELTGDTNSEHALGPVQIGKAMALEAGLNVTYDQDDDRLKWEKALPLAAEEISAANDYFSGKENPNWGLAVWRWHMGREGVKAQIENYSANHVLSFTDLHKFVHDQKITVFSILKIKNIRDELEKPGYDRTPIDVLRISACASIYNDLKSVPSEQN